MDDAGEEDGAGDGPPIHTAFQSLLEAWAVFTAFLEGRFLNSRVTKEEADAQGGAQADPRDLHGEGHGECLGRGRTGQSPQRCLFPLERTVCSPPIRQ